MGVGDGQQPNHPVKDGQVGVRRDHVDVIRLDGRVVRCRAHRQFSKFGKQLREDALVVGRKMLYNDECRRIFLELSEELLQRIEPAG